MQDITGFWSQRVIFHSHWEEESIAFLLNGTGYLFWSNLFYENIDAFLWSMDDGKITITGQKQVVFHEDQLKEVSPSTLNVKDVEVKIVKRKAMNGDVVDALEFSESLRCGSDSRFGLEHKDAWGIQNYKGLNEILERDNG